MYPDCTQTAERILGIPQRRKQRKLIGFLYPDEVLKVLASVDLRKPLGMRDYALLNLLYDSGARASEVANLNLDYFDPDNRTLAILGKGNHYRQIELLPKTVELVSLYIEKYRPTPHPLHRQRLFINQRGQQLTRHGIYKICRKYLFKTLSPKRLKDINPAHSFRHSCAIKMLSCGDAASDIQNRLGHVNTESTMVYLRIDMRRKRTVQKQFMAYAEQLLSEDPKLNELIDWENKQDILTWLDSL
jgi:site-specific recombinase XerD